MPATKEKGRPEGSPIPNAVVNHDATESIASQPEIQAEFAQALARSVFGRDYVVTHSRSEAQGAQYVRPRSLPYSFMEGTMSIHVDIPEQNITSAHPLAVTDPHIRKQLQLAGLRFVCSRARWLECEATIIGKALKAGTMT